MDEDKLCSDPSYLDGISDNIDKWVNALVPTENIGATTPFVMENKFDVVLKEDIQGIPAGTIGIIVVIDDFKTVKVDFIGTDGRTVSIHETPEKILQLVDVVSQADNG